MNKFARRIVEAPNRDSPMRGVDAPDKTLAALHVSRQLRLEVGPPEAKLSVWVLDPLCGHSKFEFASSTTKQATFKYVVTTQPSTEAEHPRSTVFLLHGLTDNKEMYPYQMFATEFRLAGYRVVMVDSRGHGRSTGDWITYGVVESRDLTQVLDQLDRQKLITGDIGVIGVSYGAATAIEWAAIEPRVKAVVALEPFSTTREAAIDAAPFAIGKLRKFVSDRDINEAVTYAGQIGGFDPDRASPISAIGEIKTPVLLIHGTHDTLLRPTNSERLHGAAMDHSKLVLIDGANHFNLWALGFERIRNESLEWFARYLSDPNDPGLR